jgi:uncharacterized protein YkwD
MMRLVLLLATALLGGSAVRQPTRDLPTPVQVVDAINIARSSPVDYADYLKNLGPRFDGNLYRDREMPGGLVTAEGMAALNDAAGWLAKRGAVPPLQISDLLNAAARVHVLEQGLLGTIGHFSADGSGPGARLKRLGGDIYVAEIISYGMPSAEAVMRQLAVDDGVRDRGHRHILFSAQYLHAGVACGLHKIYGTMCAVELARTANGAP